MKIFLVSYFAFAGLGFTCAWILLENSSPFSSTPLLMQTAVRRSAALNLTRRQKTQLRRTRRLEQRNEAPRLCPFKGKCDQVFYRNRFSYKGLFEAAPPFMSNYDNLYSRKLKGGQSLHIRGGYIARNGVYMSPDLMVVRPSSTSYGWFPSRNPSRQSFRQILFTKPAKVEESRTEKQKIETAVLFQPSSKESKLSNEETSSPLEENMRAFTEVSPQQRDSNSTSESILLEPRPSSLRPYAVKEIVDEGQLSEDKGIGNKPLFLPNIKKETQADVHTRTSANRGIVKITPLAENNSLVEKTSQKTPSNNHSTTTDYFFRIIPSHRSRGLNNMAKERPLNRTDPTKTLNLTQTRTGVLANSRSGSKLNSTSPSWLSYQNHVLTSDTTPSSTTDAPKENKTASDVKGREQKSNHKDSQILVKEGEFVGFKKRVFSSRKESQMVTPPLINFTSNEVTFLVREIVNVTDVPERLKVTWKIGEGETPTARDILNSIGYVTSKNSTTPEGFTDRPLGFDIQTVRAESKKDQESIWKNSRKMHFNQESGPNDVLDVGDQRRSDILITDNFEDYLDEEYSLGYLEKLKQKNNSFDSFRNLTSESLIPLIPQVIQDLRQGKIPPEDIFLLSEAFGDKWETILELTNNTNMDMLPLLKMKDENDLKIVAQSVLPQDESTTTQTAFTKVEYDSYDYLEKFKDLYEDLLTAGQEFQENAGKRFEKRVKGWKRSRGASDT